jgi:hypothetical protein
VLIMILPLAKSAQCCAKSLANTTHLPGFKILILA